MYGQNDRPAKKMLLVQEHGCSSLCLLLTGSLCSVPILFFTGSPFSPPTRWRQTRQAAVPGVAGAAASGERTGSTSRVTPLTSWNSSTTSALSPWSYMGSMPRQWRPCLAPQGPHPRPHPSLLRPSMTTHPSPVSNPRRRLLPHPHLPPHLPPLRLPHPLPKPRSWRRLCRLPSGRRPLRSLMLPSLLLNGELLTSLDTSTCSGT